MTKWRIGDDVISPKENSKSNPVHNYPVDIYLTFLF